MIIWLLDGLVLGMLLTLLLTGELRDGLQVVLRFATEPGTVQVGLQVRIHNRQSPAWCPA